MSKILDIKGNNSANYDDIDLKWLIEAENIVKEKHKPVCISKKGGFVMDDIGGMSGFIDFISTIYISKNLGWSSRKIELKKMICFLFCKL